MLRSNGLGSNTALHTLREGRLARRGSARCCIRHGGLPAREEFGGDCRHALAPGLQSSIRRCCRHREGGCKHSNGADAFDGKSGQQQLNAGHWYSTLLLDLSSPVRPAFLPSPSIACTPRQVAFRSTSQLPVLIVPLTRTSTPQRALIHRHQLAIFSSCNSPVYLSLLRSLGPPPRYGFLTDPC